MSCSKEEKIKTTLDEIIRERKKTIYSSLTETIEKNMQDCYDSKIKDLNMHILRIFVIVLMIYEVDHNFPFYCRSKRNQGTGLSRQTEGRS